MAMDSILKDIATFFIVKHLAESIEGLQSKTRFQDRFSCPGR